MAVQWDDEGGFYHDPQLDFEVLTELVTAPWCRWCLGRVEPIFVTPSAGSTIEVVERCPRCDGPDLEAS